MSRAPGILGKEIYIAPVVCDLNEKSLHVQIKLVINTGKDNTSTYISLAFVCYELFLYHYSQIQHFPICTIHIILKSISLII